MVYDSKKLRELINDEVAKAGKTKKDFAAECGITPETLTRFISETNPRRPSRATLKKIASNSRITFDELLAVCGYESSTHIHETDINKRCVENIKVMSKGFSELCESTRIYSSGIKSFLNEYKTCYSKENVEFLIGEKKEYEGDWHRGAEYYCPVCIRFMAKAKECRTFAVIYFCETKGGQFIPLDFSCDGKSLMEADALPVGTDDMLFEEGKKLEELPYYYEVRACTNTAEQLLKAIFGENREEMTYIRSVEGFGLIINETPENFVQFIEAHKDAFLTGKAEEAVYTKLVSESNENKEDVINEYCDEETWDCGAGAWIAKIIREETGTDITWYEGEEDADSCVMVTDESEDFEIRELRALFFPYAKELGLKKFGSCVTYIKGFIDSREIYTID